jgi:bifunctional UDP-N-acetylglucosamine pyrophosphorylase/glucosamine-1-phosphate N-acetyltransferase/UDP-N-acetylglucosamine pyrophosphorylase
VDISTAGWGSTLQGPGFYDWPAESVNAQVQRHGGVGQPLATAVYSCQDDPLALQSGQQSSMGKWVVERAERTAVILAAGKGTRMDSDLPKVLVPACGRPLIEYVLDAVSAAGVDRILVVVGHRADLVRAALHNRRGVVFVEQKEQLGTGHAVQVCREELGGRQGVVLVVTGDSPLTQTSSLAQLLAVYDRDRPACVMGTLIKDNPQGLGRIVRDAQGDFAAIVEEAEASDSQRQIKEVNMSTYAFDCRELLWALDQLANNNRKGEYYITDCPGILKSAGRDVRALPVLQPCEALSINNLDELRAVEEEMRKIHARTEDIQRSGQSGTR